MIKVIEVSTSSYGDKQEFKVTVVRSVLRILDSEAPVSDLPQDVRDALLKWLRSER